MGIAAFKLYPTNERELHISPHRIQNHNRLLAFKSPNETISKRKNMPTVLKGTSNGLKSTRKKSESKPQRTKTTAKSTAAEAKKPSEKTASKSVSAKKTGDTKKSVRKTSTRSGSDKK